MPRPVVHTVVSLYFESSMSLLAAFLNISYVKQWSCAILLILTTQYNCDTTIAKFLVSQVSTYNTISCRVDGFVVYFLPAV